MVTLSQLWLPILLSAVFVFVVSSVFHMVLPIHKGDMQKMPGEDEVLAAMRKQELGPGSYMFPCAASMKDMGSPEMVEKMKQGPVGFLTVVPSGPLAMGKSLGWWFVFSLVVTLFAGYVGTFSLPLDAPYREVFRVTGTVAILGFGASNVVDSIWKGVSWGITLKFVIDGIVYGLVTAATFAWLWPSGVALG